MQGTLKCFVARDGWTAW